MRSCDVMKASNMFSMWACKSRSWANLFLIPPRTANCLWCSIYALFIIFLILIGVVDDLVVNVVRSESVLMNDDEHDGNATDTIIAKFPENFDVWRCEFLHFFTYRLVSWSIDCRFRMLHKCNWRRCRFGKSFPSIPEKAENLDFTVANRLRVLVSL